MSSSEVEAGIQLIIIIIGEKLPSRYIELVFRGCRRMLPAGNRDVHWGLIWNERSTRDKHGRKVMYFE